MFLTDTAEKIKSMEIRGAGRIARAAAEALAEHAGTLGSLGFAEFQREMEKAADTLKKTRPTAVSLPNAVNVVMSSIQGATTTPGAQAAIARKAAEFIQSSRDAVERIGEMFGGHGL